MFSVILLQSLPLIVYLTLVSVLAGNGVEGERTIYDRTAELLAVWLVVG